MSLEEIIKNITERPTMYVLNNSYAELSAWLAGYDVALNGAPFSGFQEWLVMKTNNYTNISWMGIIHYLVAGKLDLTSEQDQKCIIKLKELLLEFIEHRKTIGLRNIFYDHGIWLRKQEWFNENVERYKTSHPMA